MSIRAEWRLAELLTPGADNPFEKVVLSSGLTVDLTGSEQEVEGGLKQSLRLEERLFNDGITCDLKDADQDCLTCALYVADRAEEPRAPLCRLGRDQRIMETRYEEMRREPFLELAAIAEGYSELGHLDPEYDAMLTAAGL